MRTWEIYLLYPNSWISQCFTTEFHCILFVADSFALKRTKTFKLQLWGSSFVSHIMVFCLCRRTRTNPTTYPWCTLTCILCTATQRVTYACMLVWDNKLSICNAITSCASFNLHLITILLNELKAEGYRVSRWELGLC